MINSQKQPSLHNQIYNKISGEHRIGKCGDSGGFVQTSDVGFASQQRHFNYRTRIQTVNFRFAFLSSFKYFLIDNSFHKFFHINRLHFSLGLLASFFKHFCCLYGRSRSNSNDSNSSGLTVILDSPAMVFQPKMRHEGEDNNDDDVGHFAAFLCRLKIQITDHCFNI